MNKLSSLSSPLHGNDMNFDQVVDQHNADRARHDAALVRAEKHATNRCTKAAKYATYTMQVNVLSFLLNLLLACIVKYVTIAVYDYDPSGVWGMCARTLISWATGSAVVCIATPIAWLAARERERYYAAVRGEMNEYVQGLADQPM